MNVTLNKEAIAASCSSGGLPVFGAASHGPTFVGPISAPSLGVEASY